LFGDEEHNLFVYWGTLFFVCTGRVILLFVPGPEYNIFSFEPARGTLFRTYAEEENCEAIFRRSGSEFIILRTPNTENGTFFGQKKAVIGDQNLNS
jgi:hypothetical protein